MFMRPNIIKVWQMWHVSNEVIKIFTILCGDSLRGLSFHWNAFAWNLNIATIWQRNEFFSIKSFDEIQASLAIGRKKIGGVNFVFRNYFASIRFSRFKVIDRLCRRFSETGRLCHLVEKIALADHWSFWAVSFAPLYFKPSLSLT